MFGSIMEFWAALLLHRTQILQNCQKYIYNSVCCFFNFNVHRPPSALKPQELSLQQPIRRTSSWQRVGLLTGSYNQIWWFLCIVISVFIFLGAYVGSKKMNPQYNIPLQPIWLKLSIPIYSAD